MNEMPDQEAIEKFLVCVAPDGRYVGKNEDNQGDCPTCILVDSVLDAKRFFASDTKSPLREPEFYQRYPSPPEGSRMMWCRLQYTAWIRGTNHA